MSQIKFVYLEKMGLEETYRFFLISQGRKFMKKGHFEIVVKVSTTIENKSSKIPGNPLNIFWYYLKIEIRFPSCATFLEKNQMLQVR